MGNTPMTSASLPVRHFEPQMFVRPGFEPNGSSFSPHAIFAHKCIVAVRRQIFEQARAILPLAAATLVCFLIGPILNAPNIVAMASVFVAAVVSSIAGFAFSAVCGGMLFHLVPNPVQAVQIMILCSIANQAAMVWSLRRNIDWNELGVFLFGGMLGLPVGVWLLVHADRAVYTSVLGALLLVYGTWMLFRRQITVRSQHHAIDVTIGFIGGITGGAAGFPGAAITIWCGFKGWDKTRQRALFQPFILVMQVGALALINVSRPDAQHGLAFAGADLLCVPPSLLGTALGLTLFRGLSDTQFTRAVNVMLIVSGLSYLI